MRGVVGRVAVPGLLGTAAIALVASLVVNGALVVLDVAHDTVLITVLALATAATGVLLVRGADAQDRPSWTTLRPDARADLGEDTRTATHRHVIEAHLTARVPDDAVIWLLADLAAVRLRQVHGIQYADDPQRVTELLGPRLAGWMSVGRRQRYRPEQRHRRYSVAELGAELARIEAL